VLVTWFILDRVGWSLDQLGTVDPTLWTPEPLGLLAASLLLFAGYAGSAVIWGRMVSDLGGPRLPGWTSVQLFMVANLGRYVPGKVWQIAGLAALARRRGVPASTATAAAVLGQGLALVAATAVGLGALVGGPTRLASWAPWAAAAVGAGVVLGLLPPVFRRLAALWFRLARQEEPEGLGSLQALGWLALYGVNWVVYAVAFWMLVASLGVDAPLLPVASAFAAAYVLGYVMIFAPAGLGVREGFLVALLTPHLGPGPSGAAAVVARLWTTGVELVPAALFWVRIVKEDGTGE